MKSFTLGLPGDIAAILSKAVRLEKPWGTFFLRLHRYPAIGRTMAAHSHCQFF
jgi:hypothetical protein